MTFAQLIEQAATIAWQMIHTRNADVLRALTAQLRWVDAQIEAQKGGL